MRKLFIIVTLIFLVSGCGPKFEGDFSFDVQNFTYTNQNGEPFGYSDLEGEFWVADMIFTNCQTVCPPMTANMARLQEMLKEKNLDVELVSFTVDPENDSPSKLKQYAADRGGEFDNWNLLTGYEFTEIKEFAVKSFKAPVEMFSDNNQFLHSVSFYLVTPEGKAIKKYDGRSMEEIKQLINDIDRMM